MLKKNKEIVRLILKTLKSTRDDDNALLAAVWGSEISFADPYYDDNWDGFLEFMQDGNLSSPESIVRVRRKLQEQHPELRGEKWKARHRAQESVKQELREF